ncbi:hypothetical protein JAAARDRAFT_63720 [Jaapia argillacea MUCL 33604]|uniref:Uncharacterized protein n=1 Tax=Jaapia argillacea MUCL 33604 TaxID=933084 RepID=A0A067PG88_9AGAM|nr:hypothetical protein JAAARDRAFT_63720 [Jaapia argillacea MUCL 33604]
MEFGDTQAPSSGEGRFAVGKDFNQATTVALDDTSGRDPKSPDVELITPTPIVSSSPSPKEHLLDGQPSSVQGAASSSWIEILDTIFRFV